MDCDSFRVAQMNKTNLSEWLARMRRMRKSSAGILGLLKREEHAENSGFLVQLQASESEVTASLFGGNQQGIVYLATNCDFLSGPSLKGDQNEVTNFIFV